MIIKIQTANYDQSAQEHNLDDKILLH